MTGDVVEPRELTRMASSPLRLALLQARTVPMLAFEQPAEVQRLVDELHGRWTVTDRQANREVAVQLGPGGVQQQTGVPETVWVLSADGDAARAAVSASSVALESDQYAHWEGFRDAAGELFAAVQRVADPARCIRLGLRYVNELRDERLTGDPQQLAELLNPALIAPALALQRPLASSLAEVRVNEGDDGAFVLRHGFVADGFYLLDLDAYHDEPEPFDPAALVARADRFHARVESVFAWALSDRYLHELTEGRP